MDVAALLLTSSALAWAVPLGDLFVDPLANCAVSDGSVSFPFCSLGEALLVAVDGDVIRIAPGTYRERVTVARDVTLAGEQGAEVTVIDGERGGTVLTLAPGTDVAIDGLTITGGLGDDAGGILSQGRLVLRSSTIRGNEAFPPAFDPAGGGLLHESMDPLTIDGCRFVGNIVDVGTTGAPVQKNGAGRATIRRTWFEHNRGRECGAVKVDGGVLEMTECTLTDNTSARRLGTVVVAGDGLLLVNSTIDRNEGSGVHFQNYASGSLVVRSCTITGNDLTSTFYAGALDSAASVPVMVSNSILLGGGVGDIFGNFVSGGYNVVGEPGVNNPTFAPAAGDLLGWLQPVPDLQLLPFADNGGPTLTRMPACDSILVDTGPPLPLDPADQRGVTRAAGRVDRGAAESDCARPPACVGVPNSTGSVAGLTFFGGTLVSADRFGLSLTGGPPQQFGMLLVSRTSGFLPGAGGSTGNLCLDGSIGRYSSPGELVQIDAAGSARVLVPLTEIPQGASSLAVVPGETWFFQAWHRDRLGTASTSNFTSTVAMSFR